MHVFFDCSHCDIYNFLILKIKLEYFNLVVTALTNCTPPPEAFNISKTDTGLKVQQTPN